ncbi:hypothetical protein [Clostridium tagluense]|uniref:Uncharacterized protein n=1 Tax=Clostridium tagluense TaxID=360422 RepID=A0A401UQE7_9CLOT|nr:hypothetical protein [Clostridium tagluense]GCD11718.1 hypothetical protein Ctaglu_33410 [Clostridium tagluense]
MKILMYHTIFNLVAYIGFAITTYKLTPKLWDNGYTETDCGFMFIFAPFAIVVPFFNIFMWYVLITGYIWELKAKEKIENKELQEKIDELVDFAYAFGTMSYHNKRICQSVELLKIYNKYNECNNKLIELKQSNYVTIHDIHNKKGEELFFKTMVLIKECYDKNTIKFCEEDILKSLTSLNKALQAQLITYEKEYNIEQNSAKTVYASRFSKLQEELRIAKEFSDTYNKDGEKQ